MARGATMLRQIAAGTYREGEIDVDAENEKFLEALRDVPLDTVHLQAAAAHGEPCARGPSSRRSRPKRRTGSARPGRSTMRSTSHASRRGSTRFHAARLEPVPPRGDRSRAVVGAP